MGNEEKQGNFLAGFFLGGILGAILLFLWGTKEGKNITKLLAEKGELLEEDIEKKIFEFEDKGGKNVEIKVKKIAKVITPVPENSPKKFFRKAGKSLTS